MPPDTIESLRKRAEGELLENVYPKRRRLGKFLLIIIAIAGLIIPLVTAIKELSKSSSLTTTQAETKGSGGGETSQAIDLTKQLPSLNEAKKEDQTTPTSPIRNHKPISQYSSRARILYDRGHYQAALKECDKALAIEPGNRDIIHLKSRIKKTLEILK